MIRAAQPLAPLERSIKRLRHPDPSMRRRPRRRCVGSQLKKCRRIIPMHIEMTRRLLALASPSLAALNRNAVARRRARGMRRHRWCKGVGQRGRKTPHGALLLRAFRICRCGAPPAVPRWLVRVHFFLPVLKRLLLDELLARRRLRSFFSSSSCFFFSSSCALASRNSSTST